MQADDPRSPSLLASELPVPISQSPGLVYPRITDPDLVDEEVLVPWLSRVEGVVLGLDLDLDVVGYQCGPASREEAEEIRLVFVQVHWPLQIFLQAVTQFLY